MGIRASHLRRYIISPVLMHLGMWSVHGENLMLLTAAQESGMGTYLRQINGPGLGLYSIEPATHKDIRRYLTTQHEKLAHLVDDIRGSGYDNEELTWNLAYATAICRIKYYMIPEPIPDTLSGWATYWKQYYNTPLGKGTVDEAIKNYTKYVKHE